MIREFSVRPKPQNKYATGACLGSFATAAALSVLYFSVQKYRGVIGLLVVASVTAAVLFYTKYIAAQYIYDITFDSEGIPVFVVRQRIGSRESTFCRVDLCNIRSVLRESAKERRAHKTEQGYTKYAYTPTLFPPVTYRITVVSRYERAEIVIEGTDEFADFLSRYAEEARELFTSDEE